jgi:hypothetical protein
MFPMGPTLEARDLLAAWGWITGPDLGDPDSRCLRRPLAGFGCPTYTRARRSARRSDRVPQPRDRVPTPRHLAGTSFVWSANSPPAPVGA